MSTRRGRCAVVAGIALLIMILGSACSTPLHGSATPSDDPQPLTAEQADRLALARLNLYRDKVVAVTATIASEGRAVGLRGWVDMANRRGYAVITPSGGRPFLSLWNTGEVSAQDFAAGASPPLPPPASGWETTQLSAGESALAAAQLLLVDLSSDRADNPQLLIQNGARWLRADAVDGVRVDVMSGPLATGATVSNLRYWVDDAGQLRRVEARLDGQTWSAMDLSTASGVTF